MSRTPPGDNMIWSFEIEGKPDFDLAMKRIYAWYSQAVIDRRRSGSPRTTPICGPTSRGTMLARPEGPLVRR